MNACGHTFMFTCMNGATHFPPKPPSYARDVLSTLGLRDYLYGLLDEKETGKTEIARPREAHKEEPYTYPLNVPVCRHYDGRVHALSPKLPFVQTLADHRRGDDWKARGEGERDRNTEKGRERERGER